MNNNEIIIDAIVANKIMTPEEMDAMLSAGKMPEYHTYKAWQNKGYQVKKGEKAALKTELWNFTDRPTKEDQKKIKAGELPEDYKNPHYYLKTAALFGREQVEPLEDTGKKKKPAKKKAAKKTKTAASTVSNAKPGAPWAFTSKTNCWKGYDKSVAAAHLENWGLVFCDKYSKPIDDIEKLDAYLRG